MNKWKILGLTYLASLGTGFGAYCIYLGHNSVVIAGVFGAIGTVAGYIVGKATNTE